MKKIYKKIIALILPRIPKDLLAELALSSEKLLAKDDQYTRLLQKIHWDKEGFSWIKLSNSWRPSLETVKTYSNFLSNIAPRSRILVLGSTPELRDMLARDYPDAEVFVCDFSWKMTLLMSTICRVADPDRETWVKTNWLHMPFPEKYFDVVLGDMIFLQFTPTEEIRLLEKILEVLKDSGALVTRCRLRESGRSHGDAPVIIHEVLQKFSGTQDLAIASRHLTRRLYGISPEDGERKRDAVWVRDVITNYFPMTKTATEKNILDATIKKIITDEEEKSAVRFRFVDPTEEEFEKLINSRCVIGEKYITQDEFVAEKYAIIRAMKRL